MVNICLNSAKKILGERPKSCNNRYKNEGIVKISEKQKRMRGQIDSTRNENLKAKKKKERNKILNEIKKLVKKENEKIIEKELDEIESKHILMSASLLRQCVY